jgi:hypothetical protein
VVGCTRRRSASSCTVRIIDSVRAMPVFFDPTCFMIHFKLLVSQNVKRHQVNSQSATKHRVSQGDSRPFVPDNQSSRPAAASASGISPSLRPSLIRPTEPRRASGRFLNGHVNHHCKPEERIVEMTCYLCERQKLEGTIRPSAKPRFKLA